jgi:hypothetical protein
MPSASDVPGKFDVVIAGEGYRFLDALESHPFGTHRANYGVTPTFLPRTNVSGDYGDNQHDFFMVFSQRDWSLGAQQRYFRSQDDDSVRRFWRGEKINVVVPGEITLSEDIATHTAAGTPLALCDSVGRVFFVTSSNLYSIDSTGTLIDHGAHGAGSSPTGLVADESGDVYITGPSSSVIRKFDGSSFSTFSSTAVRRLVFHNNSLYSIRVDQGSFRRYDSGGVETEVYRWRGADGAGDDLTEVFLGTLGGDILILIVNGPRNRPELYAYDGTAPASIATFPRNFQPTDLEVMYGIAFIPGRFVRRRSSTEYRPAIYYYSSGTIGLLWAADSWTTSDVLCHANSFQTGLVFNDDTRGVMYFYNLELGGVHEIASYTVANSSVGIASSRNFFVYARGNTTLYRWPGSGIASSGSVITSMFDGDSSLKKRFKSLVVDFEPGTDGDGGSVDVARGAPDDSTFSSFTTLATGISNGQEVPIDVNGHSLAVRVTINKGTSTTGPKVKRIKVRASPVLDSYRRCEYILDLAGRDGIDHITLRDGTVHVKDGKQMAQDLIAAAGAGVVSVTDRFGTFNGIVDTEGFQIVETRPEVFAAVVRVREV